MTAMSHGAHETYNHAPEHILNELGILARRRGFTPPLFRLDTRKLHRSDEPKTPPSQFLSLIRSCPREKFFLTERRYEDGELIVKDGALADQFLVEHEQHNYCELPLAIITSGHVDIIYRDHLGLEDTVRRLLPGDFFGVFETGDLFNTHKVRALGNNWKLVAGSGLSALFPGRSMLVSRGTGPELESFREFIIELARQDEVCLPTTKLSHLDRVAAHITRELWPRTAVVVEDVGSRANHALMRHLGYLTCQDNMWFLSKPYFAEPTALREMVEVGVTVIPALRKEGNDYDQVVKQSVDALWEDVGDAALHGKFDRLIVFSENNSQLWAGFPQLTMKSVRVAGAGTDFFAYLKAAQEHSPDFSHFVKTPNLKQMIPAGIDPQNELVACMQYIAMMQAAEVVNSSDRPEIYALDSSSVMKAARDWADRGMAYVEDIDRLFAEKLALRITEHSLNLKIKHLAWDTLSDTIETSRITRRQPTPSSISGNETLVRYRDFPACAPALNATVPSLVRASEADFVLDEQPGVLPGRGVVRISVTGLCNLGCTHCHNEGQDHPSKQSSRTTMSIKEISDLIEMAAHYGARTVRFTGGDPGVYPYFLDLMSKIEEWRAEFPTIDKWGLTTNGIAFLEDPIKMQALARSQLTNISIGIDSIDPGELSRPSSPTGVSGIEVFNGVVKPLLKQFAGGVKIDTVFTGPGTELRVRNLVRLVRSYDLPLTVLEVNGLMGKTYQRNRKAFEQLRADIAREFQLTPMLYRPLNEVYLFDHRGRQVMKFYPDHCADRECGVCRKTDSRVIKSAKDGISFVPCYEQSRDFAPIVDETGILNKEKFERGIKYIGGGPNWASALEY